MNDRMNEWKIEDEAEAETKAEEEEELMTTLAIRLFIRSVSLVEFG